MRPLFAAVSNSDIGGRDVGRDPVRRGRVVLMIVADTFEHDPRIEKQAASLIKHGFGVTVLAWNRFGTSRSDEVRGQVRILRVGIPNPRGSGWRTVIRLPRVYWWFLRTAWRVPYVAVVCHDMFTWPVGWVLRLLRRRRTVFDAHEPYAEQLVGILRGLRGFVALLRMLEGFLARRADQLITVTPALVDRYRRMGIRAVFYLPNVPSLAAFAGGAVPTRLTGETRPYVIGRVGGISPAYSGVEPLIEIGRELRRRGLNVQIVLGGPVMKGWDQDFQTLLRGAESFVEYLGVVPYTQLPSVTSRFDLVASLREGVLPETVFGVSTKLLDGMALGIPVMSTKVGEDQDLVARAGAGILVDYPIDIKTSADAVEQLIQDSTLAEAFGANGRRAVEEGLNWEHYEAAYCTVVTGGNSGGG